MALAKYRVGEVVMVSFTGVVQQANERISNGKIDYQVKVGDDSYVLAIPEDTVVPAPTPKEGGK